MGRKKAKRPTEEYYHCTECRKDLVGSEFYKEYIGSILKDGKLAPNTSRFAVFCVKCCTYLGTIDKDLEAAEAALDFRLNKK